MTQTIGYYETVLPVNSLVQDEIRILRIALQEISEMDDCGGEPGTIDSAARIAAKALDEANKLGRTAK